MLVALVVALAAVAAALTSERPADGILADLDLEALRGFATEAAAPGSILDAFIAAEIAYRFDVGLVSAWTDPRWYGVVSVSGASAGNRPILEIRRWPGDTVLAFYALAADSATVSPPGARLGEPLELRGGWRVREGRLETEGESRRILWAEKAVSGAEARCGALLVPGDAGLGGASVEGREAEMIAILERVVLPEEAWVRAETASGAALELPSLPEPPRLRDEGRDPWQAVEGPGFTLGLPPGIRAKRLDTGISAPSAVPGAALWFRGRFHDRDGIAVSIGDERRAGYAIEIASDLAAWRSGSRPPVGALAATRRDRIALDRVAVEETGARAVWVSSWTEPGFDGTWIVFGLDFEGRGMEIGIPVVEGRRSLALFWIPVTWRDATRPPAPSPIDPASRFGIRFEPTSRLERARRGDVEGTLIVPGLRAELPRGWWPSATLRSVSGFPVLLLDETGMEVGRIDRIDAGGPVREEIASGNWSERPGSRSRGALAIYSAPDGAHLYCALEGHAWRLSPVSPDGAGWSRLVGSVSLGALREGKGKGRGASGHAPPETKVNEAGPPPF